MRFHPWALVPTLLYVGFVGWITLGPSPYGSGTSSVLWHVLRVFQDHASTRWLTFTEVEGLANIGLFVPLGFFLALFLPKRLFVLAIALCALASTGIELYQGAYLPTRVEDIRDILHNGIGGAIGAVAVTLLRLMAAPRPGRRLRVA